MILHVACQRRWTRTSFDLLARVVADGDAEGGFIGTRADFPFLDLHSGVGGGDLGSNSSGASWRMLVSTWITRRANIEVASSSPTSVKFDE